MILRINYKFNYETKTGISPRRAEDDIKMKRSIPKAAQA
jgi:hypothetical protein